MKNKFAKILHRIREMVVIFYEITAHSFLLPGFLLYLTASNIISERMMLGGSFGYLLPAAFHLGMFGDKPKQIAEKIMGYKTTQLLSHRVPEQL